MGRGGGKGGMSLNAWGKPGKKGGGGTGGGGGVITAVDDFLLGLLEKVFPHQEDTKWAEDEYQFYLEQKFGQSGAEQTLADESARTGVELACKAAERYGPRQNPYPKTGLTLAEWEATEVERKRQNRLQAERNALMRKGRNRATKAARRKAETQSLKSEALAQQVQERKLVDTMLGRGSYDRSSTAKQRQNLIVQAHELKALRQQNQQNLKQGYVARKC